MVLTQLISEFKEYARDFMFPYHYGSYATIFNGEIEVSLPKFPYHYGSYATEIEFSLFFYAHTVSIPLWFLRNEKENEHYTLVEQSFPYHYGSYATVLILL